MEILKIITLVFFIICVFPYAFLQLAGIANSYYAYTIEHSNRGKMVITTGFKCFEMFSLPKEGEEIVGGIIACRTSITGASFIFDCGCSIQAIAIFVFTILLIVGTRSKAIFITMVTLSSVAFLCTIISMLAISPINEKQMEKALEEMYKGNLDFEWSKGPSFLFLVGAVLFFIPQIALAVTALVLSCNPAYQPVTGSGTFSNSNH